MKLLARTSERFSNSTGGLPVLPLVVLFGLNFVDEFDRFAFGVLAPEIKAAFGLDNAGFGLVLAISFFVLLTLSIPMGYIGDRFPRVRLVQIGALIAGVGSVVSGLAPFLWILVLARLVNGAGVLMTGPIHKSLLSDFFPAENRGSVYAVHESATPIGSVVAPILVAALGALLSWRAPFIAFAIPTFFFLLLSLRLKEPLRGGTERRDAAEEAEHEGPVPFGRSVRMLSQSKTLRRSWIGLVFVGAGLLPLITFLAIFYDTVFNVGLIERGVYASISQLAGVAGLLWCGRLVKSLLAKGRADLIQILAGAALAGIGLIIVAFAFQKFLWATVLLGIASGFIGGFYWPAALTVQSLVAPPRVRTQAFAFGYLFLAVGAFLAPIAGGIADTSGVRWGLVAFAPFLIVGGIVVASAYRFVKQDQQRAVETLDTTAWLRRERLSAADKSLLLCRDVDIYYGQVQVLFGVDFEVKEGEVVALLGTNGAGKSTLLRTIAGALTPERGLIFFDGNEISSMAPWETSKHGIVLMPGGKSTFPTLSVHENLRLAGWNMRANPKEIDHRIEEVLKIFPRLTERLHTPAGNLSGGEQQMVSLAQALLPEPKLLMIDELSLGLAPKVVGELLEVVQRIHEQGVTIILVEQSVNIALRIAKHAYFIEKGEIRFDGSTEELLDRPDILRSVFLEGASEASAKVLR